MSKEYRLIKSTKYWLCPYIVQEKVRSEWWTCAGPCMTIRGVLREWERYRRPIITVLKTFSEETV